MTTSGLPHPTRSVTCCNLYFGCYLLLSALVSSFVSHVLLDTVGTVKPLGVHHMRQRARLPAHDVPGVLKVIRKVGGHLRRVFA